MPLSASASEVRIANLIARALIACQCVICSLSASAQTQTTGRISGTVRDPAGAVVVAAQVSVLDPVTSQQRTTATDHEGSYSLSLLPPGSYDLTIWERGFRQAQFKNVIVGLAAT